MADTGAGSVFDRSADADWSVGLALLSWMRDDNSGDATLFGVEAGLDPRLTLPGFRIVEDDEVVMVVVEVMVVVLLISALGLVTDLTVPIVANELESVAEDDDAEDETEVVDPENDVDAVVPCPFPTAGPPVPT